MNSVAERVELERVNDIRHVLGTKAGRRFLWRMLGHCGIYRDFEGEPNDIYKQIGKRSVGLFLLAELSSTDQEKVFLMMKEAQQRDQEIQNDSDRESSRLLQQPDTDGDAYFGTGTDTATRKYASDYTDII